MRMLTIPSFLLALLVCACAHRPSPAGASAPVDPPQFTDPLTIDNPFHPFQIGGVKVFKGKEGGSVIVFVDIYKSETRTFMLNGNPVETRIMQETEFEDGVLTEISQNYFNQADDDTVYYWGEVVDEYEDNQVVSHGGSWLVGGPTQAGDPVDAANAPVPAVFIPGNPEVGEVWHPENLPPLVQENVRALSLESKAKTAAGTFRNSLKVKETSDIDPQHKENKWYARGVGVVKGEAKGEKWELIASTLVP